MSLRWNLLVFLFYLLLAIIITWPLVTVLGTHFAGYANGDAHEMTRHIWWLKHALQTGQPLFFQPLLGYPDGIEGVILWSDPLQFFPAWLFALVLPLPAAYNLQALLNLALNGWAAYFLVRHLTRHQPAALLAGVVFMVSPAIQGHLAGGHGGLLVQWPLPLLAWSLVRLREQFPVASHQSPVVSRQSALFVLGNSELGTRNSDFSSQSNNPELITENRQLKTRNSELEIRNFRLSTQHSALSTIVFLILLPLGHTLQLIYAGLPLVGLFALALLIERNWRALRWLIAATAAALVILLVFLLPVATTTLGTSAYIDEGGSVAYSLDLLALVTPSFYHPLYGQWEYTHRVLGTNIVEGSAYAGVAVALLALVGVWKRRESRWWLLLALVAWLLALGPLLKIFDRPVSFITDGYTTFITLPWALLQDLPLFNLARTPGRFNFLLALALAVLAGYGWAVVSSQLSVFSRQSNTENRKLTTKDSVLSPQSSVLNTSELATRNYKLSTQYSVLSTLFLAAVVLFDTQSLWPLPTYSADIPDAVAALARRDDVRAVFAVPWDNVLAAKDALWLQTAHQKPLVAGHISRKTPVDPAKLTVLQGTLDTALLKEAGADIVIVHKQYDETLAARVRATFGEPVYEDDRLALFDVPETDLPPDDIFLSNSLSLVYVATATVENRIDYYLYNPPGKTGWAGFIGTLEADSREVTLLLDGEPVQQWIIEDSISFLPTSPMFLPVTESGYHTLSFSVNPACPDHYARTLECRSLFIPEFTYEGITASAFSPVLFEQGVKLLGSQVPNHMDEFIPLSLWWQFDQPRTEQDVRFIKVLDKDDGSQVAGTDETLGNHAADSQWVETITLDLPDSLSPGDYDVYTGWYSYPDLMRFGVLADTPRAQDGLAYLGSVTVK